MEDLDVNAIKWRMFMSVTLQAAVHLRKDVPEIYIPSKKQPKRTFKQLFHATEKLIMIRKKLLAIPVIDWQQLVWQRTTLLTDKAVQLATAKTCVLSDSVLCMGGISPDSVKEKI